MTTPPVKTKTGQELTAKMVLEQQQALETGKVNKNYTDLDLNKLQQGFESQDNPELEKVRMKLHYFRLQQSEEKKRLRYDVKKN